MPGIEIPYPFINGLNPEQQEQLYRDFEAVLSQLGGSFPFIVVAADGTGNFTSIAAAIASLPVGATNFSHLIYVKTNAATYDDSGATLDLAGRNVTIWGQDASVQSEVAPSTVFLGPLWNIATTGVTASAQSRLRLVNMQVTVATNLPLFGSAPSGLDIEVEHCKLGDIFGATNAPGAFVARNSKMGTIHTQSCNAPQQLNLEQCSATLVASGKTITFAFSTTTWRFKHCTLTMNAAATFTTSGNPTFDVLFESIRGVVSNTIHTWQNLTTNEKLQFVDCENLPPLTISPQQFGQAIISLTGNEGTQPLVINGPTQSTSIQIEGIYGPITCSAGNVNMNVTCDRVGATDTALTLSSGATNCAIWLNVVPGTTQAYAIAAGANNNFIIVPNKANCPTASTDAGTGNRVLTSTTDTLITGTGVTVPADFNRAFMMMGG